MQTELKPRRRSAYHETRCARREAAWRGEESREEGTL